jgi:hypothetical protein
MVSISSRVRPWCSSRKKKTMGAATKEQAAKM